MVWWWDGDVEVHPGVLAVWGCSGDVVWRWDGGGAPWGPSSMGL